MILKWTQKSGRTYVLTAVFLAVRVSVLIKVAENLQLMKVSIFSLFIEFSVNSHCTLYSIQQLQVLRPDHHARLVFYQCVLAKYVADPKFVANTCLLTRRDGIVNFHNTHVWADKNPHTTVARRHQHWFSINVCVGIRWSVSRTDCLT